jgi:ArsR family transcriptional regulator
MTPAPTSQVDLMLRAFSDPLRLRILNLLQSGELCACDLVDILQVPQPTLSRHMSHLSKARLLKKREERSWNFYTLAPAGSSLHGKLLECLDSCVEEIPETPTDRRRARQNRKRGGCCPA